MNPSLLHGLGVGLIPVLDPGPAHKGPSSVSWMTKGKIIALPDHGLERGWESELIPSLSKYPEKHQKKVDEIEVEGEGS